MNKWEQDFKSRYGPWAVVTGASSGIGKACAGHLARMGFHLILLARGEEVLNQLGEKLRSDFGTEYLVAPLDLSTTTGVSELEEATRDLEVGLLVAAAGFGTSGKCAKSDFYLERSMLRVNCEAAMAQTLHFSKRFAEQGRGGVILFSSIVGFVGMPYAAHYAATKAYNQSLAEALSVELAKDGVDILASAPGPTGTGFADRADMQMSNTLNPNAVALETLKSLPKGGTVLPGLLTKFLIYSQSMLPRFVRVRIMGKVMEGMTRHQKEQAVS